VQLRALYPPALATHQEVVASKELFLDTLNKFHTALGAKLLAIPKIGGKALDLHFLYVEVTSRGGCQQVCFTHLLLGVSEVPHYYTEVF
jgi:hypothetical protein